MSADESPIVPRLRLAAGAGLPLLTLLLFTTKAAFEYPLGLMALLGAWQVVQSLRGRASPPDRRLLVLFGCLWLPMLLALPDALAPGPALQATASYLRLLLAGVFLMAVLEDAVVRRLIVLGTVGLGVFWALDGLIQYLFGRDLFGYPYDRTQLAGMFYPKMRLGHVLACLTPIYLDTVLHRARANLAWALLVVPLVAVILLSGKRVAWVMFGVACLGYLALLVLERRVRWRALLAGSALCLLTLGLIVGVNDPLRERLVTTLGLFSGQYERIDAATSNRLSLWRTALEMGLRHPVNGIGPRGYREVYMQYAAPEDFFRNTGRPGQTHPHQSLLEVSAETGLIGLAGYLAFLVLVLRFTWAAPAARPWALAALVAAFPLNSHLAFYGAYWSAFLWWLCAVALGLAARPASGPARAQTDRGAVGAVS